MQSSLLKLGFNLGMYLRWAKISKDGCGIIITMEKLCMAVSRKDSRCEICARIYTISQCDEIKNNMVRKNAKVNCQKIIGRYRIVKATVMYLVEKSKMK